MLSVVTAAMLSVVTAAMLSMVTGQAPITLERKIASRGKQIKQKRNTK